MNKSSSSLFDGWNTIWSDLDRMLKVGRKVEKFANPETQIGVVKLHQHIHRLEKLLETTEDKIGPNPDAVFGMMEIAALCDKAVSELLSDVDNGVVVKIRLDRP